ncbi:DEAD/DEAH box helicase [Paenibacillus abyssi]|uniref:DNA/RNA helicase n=1 Tax=Paenibacillus abyssi TaxID=1340531 RepID=A0A917FLU6_9BACL|nr:helicase-related protein [Paenibacillus abyssi]GGF91589.1 hypothetical protein GCM10010916_06090 [Paenibacillus abyssi]
MKGWVYVVEEQRGLSAFVTIEPEIDRLFWLDAEFQMGIRTTVESVNRIGRRAGAIEGGEWIRSDEKSVGAVKDARKAGIRENGATGNEEVELYGGGGKTEANGEAAKNGITEMNAGQLWMVDSPLALGIAVRAADLWEERFGIGKVKAKERAAGQSGDSAVGKQGGFSDAANEIKQCVALAIKEADAGLERNDAAAAPITAAAAAVPIRHIQADRSPRGAAARTARRAEALAAAALAAAGAMQGRALLHSEAHALLAAAGASRPGGASWNAVLQLAALLGRLRLRSAIAVVAEPRRWGVLAQALGRPRRRCRCKRCGSGEARMRRTPCAACGRMCAYCEACIGMGRARECSLLLLGGAAAPLRRSSPLPQETRLRRWGLSPAQLEAAGQALACIEAPSPMTTSSKQPSSPLTTTQSPFPYSPQLLSPSITRSPYSWSKHPSKQTQRVFMLWAVTGAGKTEMIFPLIESVLLRGGRALVATPRRDVVLELDPRIRKAFPGAGVVTLYGGSEQRWEQGEITLATTHQLLRFEGSFELVIIDELDAFPFHGDPVLHYAADKVCALHGAKVLLTATPPAELRRDARRGRLPYARVPVRYHGHPLPVPVILRIPAIKEVLHNAKLPAKLVKVVLQSVERGAQLFLFVQRIRHVDPLVRLLRTLHTGIIIEGTSSQDPQRGDKVQRFRRREIRLLVTTTILERGVTVPRSDVFILDADEKLFDDASLIQMAGRAGRSADDPHGKVYFCSPSRSRSQASAIRQIMMMNRTADKKGYLINSRKGIFKWRF